jgi:hypothetical protein
MKPDQLFMVFDVESVGLHGEGFAVGYVVVEPSGEVVGGKSFACHPDRANGGPEGRAWVAENCPPFEFNCASPSAVRRRFWQAWQSWKDQGAVLVADCAWPVEARFLIACVDDAPEQNTWNGPYPLHELASFMVAAGMDPMATYDRLPDEPQHDPLGDARQSARLLLVALAAATTTAPAADTPSAPDAEEG